MRRQFLTSALAAVTTLVFAAPAFAECSGVLCANVHISMLSAESGALGTNDVWIQTTGTESSLTCVPDSGIHLKLAAGSQSKKEVYAMLLAAYVSDLPVTIRVVSGSQDCNVAYVFLTR